MKRVLFSFLFLQFFWACNNPDKEAAKPEGDLDAARTFIRDALDGRFSAARQLMLPDSTNDQRMTDTERTYQNMSQADKVGQRNATIQIHKTREVSDSIKIVSYSNSYKNIIDSLRLVRINEQWLVDLKFTFQDRLPNAQ